MVETYVMGFKALHGNGDHDNVTLVNYRGMGFGWIVDTRLAPLMLLGVWGRPSLGIGSMNDLVILLGSLMVWSWLYAMNGGNFLVNKGMLHWFYDNI